MAIPLDIVVTTLRGPLGLADFAAITGPFDARELRQSAYELAGVDAKETYHSRRRINSFIDRSNGILPELSKDPRRNAATLGSIFDRLMALGNVLAQVPNKPGEEYDDTGFHAHSKKAFITAIQYSEVLYALWRED